MCRGIPAPASHCDAATSEAKPQVSEDPDGRELQDTDDVSQNGTDETSTLLFSPLVDPRVTDLSHFRATYPFEKLSSSGFTLVDKIGDGINGEIFKYKWSLRKNDPFVVVKKLRNVAVRSSQNTELDERTAHRFPRRNAPSPEDALTEIGVLTHLSEQQDLPVYLLKMLGVYTEDRFTWLITEFADGGDLFDVAASRGLAEAQIKKYSWQLLQAVSYLHRHRVGHRDISLENVLLKGDTVRLMDYGMAVCSHSPSGIPLRYFREVGKDFYRAPECYVPTAEIATVTAPLSSCPCDVVMVAVDGDYLHSDFLCEVRLPEDSVPGNTCVADVWGYTVVPADVFSLGICMFILSFQFPPWDRAQLNDRNFSRFYEAQDAGLQSLLQSWGKQQRISSEALKVLSNMLHSDPAKRPSGAACLRDQWFAEMHELPVEVHA